MEAFLHPPEFLLELEWEYEKRKNTHGKKNTRYRNTEENLWSFSKMLTPDSKAINHRKRNTDEKKHTVTGKRKMWIFLEGFFLPHSRALPLVPQLASQPEN